MTDTEFYKELYSYYTDISNYIIPIGQKLDTKFGSDVSGVFQISRDILKRINGNLISLGKLGAIDEYTCVAHKLIIRAIHSDIILGVYLLTCSEEERIEELRKQNTEALKSIESWATSRKGFYDSLPTNQETAVDFDSFYKNYSEFVDPATGKIYTGKGTKGTSIKQLSDKLTNSKVLVIQKFNQLNTNYKLLSLTEHYHPITRRHSYNLEVDKFIYLDFAKWMKLSINILTQIIDEWIETGTFVVTGLEDTDENVSSAKASKDNNA